MDRAGRRRMLLIPMCIIIVDLVVLVVSMKFQVCTNEINSLAPGRCGCNSKSVISGHMSRIKFMGTSCWIDFWRMPQKTMINQQWFE